MSGKNVFIVGPGFIGWNIIDDLVPEGYKIRGLVRRKEHADGISASGAEPVLGDLNDKKLIADETAKADIVFHTATADHPPSAEAVIDGVRRRAAEGKSTIYIHTSGTSVLDDNSKNEYKTDKVYYDNKPEEIDAVPDEAPHRPIDLAIVNAAKEIGDKAKIALMIPPEIYGFNPAHGRLTIQFPTIARYALKHGFAGYAGKGLGVESQVHVKDLSRAYVVLLHALEKNPPSYVLQNPYFFCENGSEFSWYEVAQNVGQSLHKAGRLQDPNPKQFSEDTYGDLFGPYTYAVIGLNSRSRAVRLRELGWEPKEKSIWDSWEQDELPQLLKEWDASDKKFAGYFG